jgi:5-methylcytosine-specific restriction protein A
MEIQIVSDDGATLNAKVEIEPGAIIVHSRGGAFDKPNLRNPDHKRALETILRRLLAVGLAPSGVFLDSGPARAAPVGKRMLLAAAEITGSVSQLVTEIGKRGAAWGRPEGAAGRGNATKRVRIGVPGATAVHLAAILRPGRSTGTPIVYFNIGWMREYAGPKVDDPTIGAHGL